MTRADEPRDVTVDYYAVLDPDDPDRMTYWYRTKRGRIMPHPPKAHYGPVLFRADVPAGLDQQARGAWVSNWFRTVSRPWHQTVREAIEADPVTAGARFAKFACRCCCCGRTLTDPDSKTYGVGPDCRSGLPASILAQLNEAVGRVHAASVTTGSPGRREEL